MSLSFVLGNILGRLLVSYLIVFAVCCLAARLKWRAAFARSKRWYSVVAVVVLTMLGLGGAVVRGGGIA